jgi:hypothetical protein
MARHLHKCFVVCVFVIIGCSPKTLIVRQMTDIVETGITAFERDDDLDMIEKALPANIKLLEAMLINSPDDRHLMILLSRMYGSYSFGFIETRLEEALYLAPPSGMQAQSIDSLKDQVNRYYEKGIGFALTALEKSVPGATDALRKVNTIGPYLNTLGKKDVASLFWFGFNLGGWVNRNLDSIRAVSQAHVTRKVMERVIELDPAYYHGGAHLFLIAYFGSRPPMMGGSQEKAIDHYQRLKQIVGDDFLLADLFYGRFCLQPKQDREGFVNLMRRISERPAGRSDGSLFNAIAGRRAVVYLAAVGILFE